MWPSTNNLHCMDLYGFVEMRPKPVENGNWILIASQRRDHHQWD